LSLTDLVTLLYYFFYNIFLFLLIWHIPHIMFMVQGKSLWFC